LIGRGNEKELEDTLNDYLDHKIDFEKEVILKSARNQFSSEKIGLELFDLYKSVT